MQTLSIFRMFQKNHKRRPCYMVVGLPHVYDRWALCNETWLLFGHCVGCLWHFQHSGQMSVS
jgi:hypothetical protein